MRSILNKKRAILGLVATVAITAVAVAYWTSAGEDTGSATTGDATAFTVEALDTPSGLVPDGAAQDLDVKVTNTASHDQQFNSVDISISSITEATGVTEQCDPQWFTVTDPAAAAITLQEANGTASDESTRTGSIALDESGTNQDACKGATVNLDYEVN